MDVPCGPAPAGEVSAEYVPGRLVVRATGVVSDACWEVSIERLPTRVWPPEFAIEACHTSQVCPEVETPYDVRREFATDTRPEEIVVHDEGGRRTITVEAGLDGSTTPGPDEAIGVSLSLSLGDAIADAASRIPQTGHPNVPRTVTVEDIWYSTGGVVGQALYVRVRRG